MDKTFSCIYFFSHIYYLFLSHLTILLMVQTCFMNSDVFVFRIARHPRRLLAFVERRITAALTLFLGTRVSPQTGGKHIPMQFSRISSLHFQNQVLFFPD